MILPNVQNILIEKAKIVDYLLNPAHPDNGGKAAFFNGWGFVAADWARFADALRVMVAGNEIVSSVQSAWGEKYVVDGSLNAPAGMTPPVRTIWIVDHSSTAPRLVTAYSRR